MQRSMREETTDALRALCARIATLMPAYGSHQQDIRYQALRQCLMAAHAAFTHEAFLKAENLEKVVHLSEVYQSQEAIAQFIEDLSQYDKASLITAFLFSVENLLRSIALEIQKSSGTGNEQFGKYRRIAEYVTSEAELADHARSFDILMAASYIRNCLHQSGIHIVENSTIKIGGLTFEFFKDEVVSCASWKHIVTALDAVVTVVGEILRTPKVMAIPAPLYDRYGRLLLEGRARTGGPTPDPHGKTVRINVYPPRRG
jgi:hypothetical protein